MVYIARRDWTDVEEGFIDSYRWPLVEGYRPTTAFRIRWDDEYISLRYRVLERYVRCVETRYGGTVWRDSCVEFFFSPGTPGYFNLEVNCGGTYLFAYQTARDENRVLLPEREASRIKVLTSLPKLLEPEVESEIPWQAECHIPYSLLESVAPIVRPAPGAVWRANLYKCAEANSHPHHGSWSPIETPKPDFHQPAYFGDLRFEP